MPDLKTLFLFTAAAMAITASPGPSMLYVFSRSIALGRAAGILSALGLATGLMFHTVLASLGLSAIFVYSPAAYTLVRYLGAAYLIYLGIRTLLTGGPLFHSSISIKARIRYVHIYGQGIMTEVLNPKTALFFLSFLPQFVDVSRGPASFQMFLFGCMLLSVAFSADVCIALTGSTVSKWLIARPVLRSVQRWISGTVLIGLGIRLVWSERAS